MLPEPRSECQETVPAPPSRDVDASPACSQGEKESGSRSKSCGQSEGTDCLQQFKPTIGRKAPEIEPEADCR